MQITETLNDQQRLMSNDDKQMLRKCYPIFNEMESAGYEVEYYYISGFGGLTVVPSVGRVRIKANPALFQTPELTSLFAHKVRQSFESRLTNAKFLAGKKVSTGFKHKDRYQVPAEISHA